MITLKHYLYTLIINMNKNLFISTEPTNCDCANANDEQNKILFDILSYCDMNLHEFLFLYIYLI